jgi:hypothetical protein
MKVGERPVDAAATGAQNSFLWTTVPISIVFGRSGEKPPFYDATTDFFLYEFFLYDDDGDYYYSMLGDESAVCESFVSKRVSHNRRFG